MDNITILGIDIAKSVFQLAGLNKNGKKIYSERVSRKDFVETILKQSKKITIVMEACSSSHHWARRFSELGFNVKLIAPQFVKPFVKGNKNDAHDALAIAEAASRPDMRYVPIKSIEQQDILSIHRARALMVKTRTALANQIRGLLAEYGIIIPKGITRLRAELPYILENKDNELSVSICHLLNTIYENFKNIDKQILAYEKQIKAIAKKEPRCQFLLKVPGIGEMTATALVASVGNAAEFQNGRQMAAWMGLVPKHSASGNKQKIYGISKRGDRYLRTLLIHGARAVIQRCQNKVGKRYEWIQNKYATLGYTKASVALANKMAREAWAVLNKGDKFNFSF